MSDAQDNSTAQETGGRDLSQANPLNKAIHSAAPGVPRSIRAHTGQTNDPLPEGKQVEERKVRLPVTATEPVQSDAQQIAAIAAGAHPQADKEDKKAKREEMERLHGDAKGKYTKWETKSPGAAGNQPDTKQMDSRRSHFGQSQHSSRQS